MRTIGALLLLLAFSLPGFAIDKKEFERRYKGKYLVVLREGVAIGFNFTGPDKYFSAQLVRIDGDHAELGTRHTFLEGALPPEERIGAIIPEAVHPGEVLHVRWGVKCCPNDSVQIGAESVALHPVTRGRAAKGYESYEVGKVLIQFAIPNKTDYDAVASMIDKWLKPFDSPEEAAAFVKGMVNTASGALVKEVKLGMTPAEVESVMGLPVSKADLGEKVLYKYKDMTVEFHDGKVADVR